MLKRTFTLASAVSLGGAVVWMTSTAGCGGTETSSSSSSSSGSSGDSGASSSGTASSSSSSSSSSGSAGQDAGLVDPNTVEGETVVFGKCEAFTKCDGSIAGSWKVTGGCLADSTFDSYRTFCKDLKEHDVVIKASGTVDATEDPNLVKQATNVFLSAKMDVPKACASFIPGGAGCSSLPGLLTSGLAGGKFDHAVCTEEGDLCKCAGDVMLKENTSDEYTTDGTGVLTTKSNRKYEYCPSGGKITYRETTKDNRTFGMFLTLTKQ